MDYRELTVKVGQANPLDFRSGDDFELHKLQRVRCLDGGLRGRYLLSIS
jgi:hypothetical protein